MSKRITLFTTPQALFLTAAEGKKRGLQLAVGERVMAKVILAEGNRAVVEIKGTRIAATTTAALPEGEVVSLLVASITKGRIILRLYGGEGQSLRPASDADLLAALGKGAIAPTRDNLDATKALLRFGLPVTQSNVRLAAGGMPIPRALALLLGAPATNGVMEALGELASRTPVSELSARSGLEVPTPRVGTEGASSTLKALIARLLSPLERAIAQGRTAEIGDDLRARLLAQPRTDGSPEAALARKIEGMGVFNAARATETAEQVLYFQIPVRWGDATKTVELRIARDQGGEGSESSSALQFRVSLETQRLGAIVVQGLVAGTDVWCVFETESQSATSKIVRAQRDLEGLLEAAGFKLHYLSSRVVKDLGQFPRLLAQARPMATVDVLT